MNGTWGDKPWPKALATKKSPLSTGAPRKPRVSAGRGASLSKTPKAANMAAILKKIL